MYSETFLSSDAARRIRSISKDSGSQTVTRDVFFSAISGCFPAHNAPVQANKLIAKNPVRRLARTTQQARNMALPSPAFLRDLRLRKSAIDKVLNEYNPVHASIITYVIDKGKHHRDCTNADNHKMDSLAQRLIAKREALDLSQAELAKKAGLKNQSIIGMLESGARKSSSHIPAIAHALGVESLWLSSGTGPESRGSAKTYELTEVAMKIALLVNEMSDAQQVALLSFLTGEKAKIEDQQSVKNLPPAETKNLLAG